MKSNYIFLVWILLVALSCSKPVARKPINHASGYDQSESIAFNKKMYLQESEMINLFIKKDTLHDYINSKYGFWYAFENENIKDTIFPVKGNIVKMKFDVYDFDGSNIYTLSEIGEKSYKVDQEELMQGLREGIKLMNKGEKVIFLLPSHKAFAYHGDEDKIGPNTPIIVRLELLNIQKN